MRSREVAVQGLKYLGEAIWCKNPCWDGCASEDPDTTEKARKLLGFEIFRTAADKQNPIFLWQYFETKGFEKLIDERCGEILVFRCADERCV